MREAMIFSVCFFCLFSISIFSQRQDKGSDRNHEPESPGAQDKIEGIDVEKQYLVLIAIDEYDEWGYIRGPEVDARKLRSVLTTHYHFDVVKELYNKAATKTAIFNLIKSFRKGGENQLSRNDSLFIYYSGHGELDKDTNKGYWIPVDGGRDKIAKSNWIDNSELSGLIENEEFGNIESDHILIVSDSCFAGTLVNTAKGNRIIEALKTLNIIYPLRSCKVLTSGAKEYVKSKSKFAELFIDELKVNKDKLFVTIASIFNNIELEIVRKTKNRPLYGDLEGVLSREGSHFILFTKKGWEKVILPYNKKISSPPEPPNISDEIKRQKDWVEWQKRFEVSVNERREIDRSKYISPEIKKNNWIELRENFRENNPYSEEDERLRDLIKERITFWNNYMSSVESAIDPGKAAERNPLKDKYEESPSRNKNSFLKGDGDRLYEEICTQGAKGFIRFFNEYPGDSKISFWRYFVKLIRNLNDNEKFEKILACLDFWNHLKQSTLFQFKSDDLYSHEREAINKIFLNAKWKYRRKQEDKMKSREPLSVSPEKMEAYIGDKKFANIARDYNGYYKKIQDLLPPGKGEVRQAKAELGIMTLKYPLDIKIKSRLDNYLDMWGTYYQIAEGRSYAQKELANRRRKDKLNEIRWEAGKIHAFGISDKVSEIDNLISEIESKVNRWNLHEVLNGIISDFENKSDPTLIEIYDTRERLLNTAGDAKLEKSISDRIKVFSDIPEKGDLNVDSLDKYLKNRWDFKSNVIRGLKNELKKKLVEKLQKHMYAGGSSSGDLEEVKKIENVYEEFFGENTSWHGCIMLMDKYYRAMEAEDYPTLMGLYHGTPDIVKSCSKNVLDRWNILSREKVKANYSKYFDMQIIKVLKGEGKRSESDFKVFTRIYQDANRYWELSDENKSRYDFLKSYFTGVGDKAKENAAKALYNYYPQLAQSYSISEPPKVKIPVKSVKISQPEGSGNQQEDILKFIETMLKYVKADRLMAPTLRAVCSELIISKSMRDFQEVVEKYRDKVPRNYDFQMNRFFKLIYDQASGWEEEAAYIIKKGKWDANIKDKMEEIHEEVRSVF